MTQQDRSDGPGEALRGELVPAAAPESVREWAEQLVAQAREDGVALTGEGGLLTDLMRHVLQTGLEVEMAEHLGYGPHERAGRGSGNSRNGAYDKTVVTEIGEVDLRVPRDRQGTFEPVTVPKYQRRLDGLSGNVISLYAKGLTTGDIQQHLHEIYGTEVSRDVLGLWLGPSGGEGAKQWATMLTELRNRGLHDALIVCCDGLKGLPESIRLTWPEATVQTCVVHMVRNSLRYSSKKHWTRITQAMREIYTAPTVEAAEARFAEFAGEWEPLYPAMIQAWRQVWTEFVPFLEYPLELRKAVYTTNAIESLNARFRRAVRHRGHFPNEQSALKVLYRVAIQKRKNRADMTGRINGWKSILNTLTVHYGDRIAQAGIN